MNQLLDDVDRAIKDIAAGRPVLVVDDENRENEGDIIFAASMATPELLAFMIRYTSGVICVPMREAELDRLQLPQMTAHNTEHHRTAFTVSVDARDRISTGISAADRAATIAKLVDPATTAADLVRPGHVFPLRYAEGGVLRRPGHTEAAVDISGRPFLAFYHEVCWPCARRDLYYSPIAGAPCIVVDFGTATTFDVVTEKTRRSRVSFEYSDESDHVRYPIPKRVHIEGGSDHHALLLDKDAGLSTIAVPFAVLAKLKLPEQD